MDKETLNKLTEMDKTIEHLAQVIREDDCANMPERHFFVMTADASCGGSFGGRVYDRINKATHDAFIKAVKSEMENVVKQFNEF